jgi:hypothetical protein
MRISISSFTAVAVFGRNGMKANGKLFGFWVLDCHGMDEMIKAGGGIVQGYLGGSWRPGACSAIGP